MQFTTGFRAIVTAKSDTTENPIAFTDPLDTTQVRVFRLGVELTGNTDCEVRFMLQFSDDGVVWGTAEGIDIASGAARTSSAGWTFMDAFKTIPTDITASQKLFVRFGLMVRNDTAAATTPACATARLRVDIKAQPGRTYAAGPRLVATGGDATGLFYPFVTELPTEDVGFYRVTVERQSNSGLCSTRAGYQTSTDGGVTWSTATGIGTSTKNDGIEYGSDFTSTDFGDKQLVRFGALAKNDSDSEIEAGVFSLRLDTRPVE